jgi:NADPH2:quinone reductase
MASHDIPKTMEGVVINKTGGTEVLEFKTDLPVPQPKEGQILIKNEYTGVNYIDTQVYHYISGVLKIKC